MIRQLRIKFICIVMAIVTVMLSVILGVVIHFTGSIMEMQSVAMMRTIADSPFHRGKLKGPSNQVRLPFFTVRLGKQGEILNVEGGYFDLSDEENIRAAVETAWASGQETGELEEYQLRYLRVSAPRGDILVFSDTTTEAATLRNLIYSCLLIFIAALLIFLGITVLLSHWAIRPVALAWERQRQFVADASHELKTPLSVIMANAELLQNEHICEEERNRFAGHILSTSYQMRSLVENMLEMARVDNGMVNMHIAPLDFSQLVTDSVLSVQLLFEEQGMELDSVIPEGVRVAGSEQHLFQVLDVLLDNALKYSASGGTVRVALERSGRSCLLSVAGPGEPISRKDLDNIFKRFYRGDKSRAMNGSYGLGLSIAQSVVLAHKGKIWAQSEGGVNTFFVQLPALPENE